MLKGDVGSTLIAFVDEHDIDLIVIASRGRSGMKRALLGSVADEVVRRAPCPVLVVKGSATSLVPERSAGEASSG